MLNSFQITLILLIILSLVGYITKSKDTDFSENFDNYSKYTLREDVDKIYNSFYSNIYDELFNSATKNQFEIYNINMYTISDKKEFTKNEINFLDIGCGTGSHLKIIQSYKFNVVGLDNSKKMLIKARQNNQTSSLVKGDFHNKEIGIFCDGGRLNSPKFAALIETSKLSFPPTPSILSSTEIVDKLP